MGYGQAVFNLPCSDMVNYSSIPLNTNFVNISHAKERNAAGRHAGGRQRDRTDPGPDAADAPEQVARPLANLRDPAVCGGSGHQGFDVRLRPEQAGPRPLQAHRRDRHVVLRGVGRPARVGACGHSQACGAVSRPPLAQAGPGRPPAHQTKGEGPEIPVQGLREARFQPPGAEAPAGVMADMLSLVSKGVSLARAAEELDRHGHTFHRSTIYRWVKAYGPMMEGYASKIRPWTGYRWYYDEVYCRILGDGAHLFTVMDY